ncbi:hypothetical protein Pmani_010973 [Petrolisthes manimaculis]|uniref:Uncharacterized protein n=1 Tax=Petrolisthes manimaculis TaxID=1843537 RepID=A0AAE1UEZ8_9EUCA|nr:hypothetical protein Pmani_010973 [Petrolisthes manimaculis]
MLVDLARARIVKLWIIGMPARIISLHTGASVSTVYRWVRRWQRKDIANNNNNTNSSNNNNKGTRRGRPRETLRRDMLPNILLSQLILLDLPPLPKVIPFLYDMTPLSAFHPSHPPPKFVTINTN